MTVVLRPSISFKSQIKAVPAGEGAFDIKERPTLVGSITPKAGKVQASLTIGI